MILRFDRFNESFTDPIDINEGDRVITHGKVDRYNNDGRFYIDIEGKTGIVAKAQRGGCTYFGIVYDNHFSYFLDDLDGRIKIKNGLWVDYKKVEKVNKNPNNKGEIRISKKLQQLLVYVEFNINNFFGDIDYVDVSSSPDTVTYIPGDRIARLDRNDDVWNNKYRQEMRIGKFLQILNPYTDKINLDRKINSYKSIYNGLILNKYKFSMVQGEDIRKWYDERNYYPGAGSLNRSCMRKAMDKLDIYCENPDKVGLLIMLDEDNKLMGRALVWHVDEPNVVFMDRAYTVYQEDQQTFQNFAEEQGWKYWSGVLSNGLREKSYIFFNKNYGKPDYNPFMDTFQAFVRDSESGKKNYLTNMPTRFENYYLYDEA